MASTEFGAKGQRNETLSSPVQPTRGSRKGRKLLRPVRAELLCRKRFLVLSKRDIPSFISDFTPFDASKRRTYVTWIGYLARNQIQSTVIDCAPMK